MVETATPRSSDSGACVGCVSQQPIWRHELLVLCSIMLLYAHRSGSWKKLATIRKNYEYIIRGFLKRIDSQVPFPSFHRQAWRFAAPRGPGVTCRREHHMRTSPINHQRFHHGVPGPALDRGQKGETSPHSGPHPGKTRGERCGKCKTVSN